MTSESEKMDLTPLDDGSLVLLARNGIREAVNVLLCRYRPFVCTLSAGYSGFSLEKDDIIQEGLIGLLSAIYSFSPDRGASFRTYCSVCVNNAMRSAVRSDACRKNLPLNTSVPFDGEEMISRDSPEDIIVSEENKAMINRLIGEKLSALEYDVLTQHISGLDYKAAAEKLGISEKAVDNALQRVRMKLGKALNEN